MQKSVLGKSVKIAKKKKNLMHFFTPSKNVGPNLKPNSEIFLSEFYDNGLKNLPTPTNDWVIESWSGDKFVT